MKAYEFLVDLRRRGDFANLTTTAAAVPGGQLHHVLTQLSVDHAALFGRPEPA